MVHLASLNFGTGDGVDNIPAPANKLSKFTPLDTFPLMPLVPLHFASVSIAVTMLIELSYDD